MYGWEVNVLFTTAEPTLAALKTACGLARGLGAQVRFITTLAVPYPLPLSSPPVPVGFTEGQIRRLASGCSASTRVELYLCRDLRETLSGLLKPGSLVVMGVRQRWWGSREQRMAQWLRKNGHDVVLAAPEKKGGVRTRIRDLLQFRSPNPSC
ncbi:MAG: hypothetical protein HY822_15765 [Acidobacteria bacterium]|nr:hypothetical protein [Acidobacteriota bacterium]